MCWRACAGKQSTVTGAAQGATILDVATGTGKQAYAYVKNGYHVTGIDLSEDMLRIARKNNKYPNLKLELGDATQLPYRDGQFDVASVSFALHDMPPEVRDKVLAEMVRVTKPRGTIVAVDYGVPKNALVRFVAYQFIKSFESIYYPEFFHNNFAGLLQKHGVRLEVERSVLLGAGRILKGIKETAAG